MLGILFFYFNYFQKQFYIDQLVKSLEYESRLILNNSKVDLKSRLPQEIDQWVKKWGKIIEKRITIIDIDGTVVADSDYDPEEMDNHGNRPEIISVVEGAGKGISIRYSKTLKKDMLYVSIPIKRGGNLIGFIRLSKSLHDINTVNIKNIRSYLIFSLLFIVLTMALIWKFSLDIFTPLKRITKMARKLARGELEERIRLRNYQNEIGTLSQAFNYMADQLQKKIEEISEEKSRAEAILNNTVNGLIATNKYNRVRIVNPAARKMLGIEEKEVKGRELIEVVRNHKIVKFLETAFNKDEIINKEIILQRTDKKVFSCSFVPIHSEGREVTGGIIVFNDITELRKLEQVRKEFVANASHELKTPLTSIIGYVDTILENDIKDHKMIKRFLNIIKNEADRLYLLIRDLLDLSKLENNSLQGEMKPSNLVEIIHKASDILDDKAYEKDINLMVDVQKHLPPVKMIPEQIEQVLINLIDNAIKYTPEGGEVIIRAYRRNGKVFVEVEDNGIGIPAGDLDRIFERFYRVDKARSRKLGGTGIGLSIVKHIIQNHDSEIEVESEQGKGSVFRFWLMESNI